MSGQPGAAGKPPEQVVDELKWVQAPLHQTPVPGDTDWRNYTHQQLYAMIMSADPVAVHARANEVRGTAQAIDDAASNVVRSATTMLSAWSGSAAGQAAQNINTVTQWADETTQSVNQIATGFTSYAEALDRARTAMPEPIDWGAVNKALNGGTVHLNSSGFNAATIDAIAAGKPLNTPEAQARELQNKHAAIQVMSNYHQTSTSVARSMPTLSPAPIPKPGPISIPDPVTRTDPTTNPTTDPTSTSGATTLSSATAPVLAPPGTGSIAGGGYRPDLGALGGAGSGGLVNADGGWGGFGPAAGLAARSGAAGSAGVAGAAAEEEAAAGRGAAAAEPEEGGPGGFVPGGGGRRPGDDVEHRNRYAQPSDLIGDLPEAFPPTLGL